MADNVTTEIERLQLELRPRLALFSRSGQRLRYENLVGSFSLGGKDVIEVSPKVDTSADWASAVVALLEPDTRISVTGSRTYQANDQRISLSSALASEYARRLSRALRSEGPLVTYERRSSMSRRFQGRLDVTKWAKTAVLDPSMFPVNRDEFTSDNDFTRGLSVVANRLSRVAAGGQTSSRLRRLSVEILPGHPQPHHVNPAAASRSIPSQWVRYRPAWDIAAALLRNVSVMGEPGRATGLEVAVEPWPLLETALTRALKRLAQSYASWEFVPKRNYRLLSAGARNALKVEPDGALLFQGRPAVTFECKYTVPGPVPDRGHVYQALATAAAVGSKLSVIVYPGQQEAKYFEVSGFNGLPHSLMTMGISLYDYRSGQGDEDRANRIHGHIARSFFHE